MALDIEAGRETELEAMTGYLVRKAASLGVPVPVTETVYRLAKGVEYAARAKHQGRVSHCNMQAQVLWSLEEPPCPTPPSC